MIWWWIKEYVNPFANTDFKSVHMPFRINWINLFVVVVFHLLEKVFSQKHSTYCIPVCSLPGNESYLVWGFFLFLFFLNLCNLCISWRICVAFTSSWQLEGMWLCVCVCGKRWTRLIQCTHTHAHTYIQTCMWLVGVFCPGRAVKGSWDPLRSRINHCALEQLGLRVD